MRSQSCSWHPAAVAVMHLAVESSIVACPTPPFQQQATARWRCASPQSPRSLFGANASLSVSLRKPPTLLRRRVAKRAAGRCRPRGVTNVSTPQDDQTDAVAMRNALSWGRQCDKGHAAEAPPRKMMPDAKGPSALARVSSPPRVLDQGALSLIARPGRRRGGDHWHDG